MAYAVVLGAAALILGWFLFSGRDDAPEPTLGRRADDDVDHATLDAAEREVRDAPSEETVRDWGPGVGKAPPAA